MLAWLVVQLLPSIPLVTPAVLIVACVSMVSPYGVVPSPCRCCFIRVLWF